jgi:ribonuclease PH
MARPDGRRPAQLRPVRIVRHFLKNAPSSVLIQMGNTRVLCAATVDESVPPFLKGAGRGWVTAEYAMLPASTSTRKERERSGKIDGRTQEIQRLIGRSLRAVTDMSKLGERTIRIDCDVIDADGGTRTAAITGAYVALADCVEALRRRGSVSGKVLRAAVAATSVGMVAGKPVLDLSYVEDSAADVDMNVVMTSAGRFVEVQGTAESRPFDGKDLDALLALAKRGIARLIRIQKEALSGK